MEEMKPNAMQLSMQERHAIERLIWEWFPDLPAQDMQTIMEGAIVAAREFERRSRPLRDVMADLFARREDDVVLRVLHGQIGDESNGEAEASDDEADGSDGEHGGSAGA